MAIPFNCGNWTLDETNVLCGPHRKIKLAPSKTTILKTLVARINSVVRTRTLVTATGGSEDSLKVVVCRLRKDLISVGADCVIRTSSGEGYMLKCESEIIICPSFTKDQWTALKHAIVIAERHEPGLAEKTGMVS